jgi:hypothetical protein
MGTIFALFFLWLMWREDIHALLEKGRENHGCLLCGTGDSSCCVACGGGSEDGIEGEGV